MSAQVEWLRDLAEACDELGYYIARVEPSEIELHPKAGLSSRDSVIVKGICLSASHLRRILVPVAVEDDE